MSIRNRPLTPKEKEAWDFAKELHKDQVRKFINKSYFIAHVQKVNGIVKQYTTDEDILCAALLHDVIEDCFEDPDVGHHILEEKFGKRVADIDLPEDSALAAILRDGRVLTPKPEDSFATGDELIIIAAAAAEPLLQQCFAPEH